MFDQTPALVISRAIIVKRHYRSMSVLLAHISFVTDVPGADFSEQILECSVCGGRPRHTALHAILPHVCSNNTNHMPYCLRVSIVTRQKPLQTERVTECTKK